ncbi:MAG: hypothetical protein HRT71_06100 [Flavobacteriales bacterium]|nr:hypothetical protein [Flavobacteriales bacterium]
MKKSDIIKIIFSSLGLLGLLALFLWGVNREEKMHDLLDNAGMLTEGITIESKSRKRGEQVKYYYVVNGERFEYWRKIPVNNGTKMYLKIPNGKYEVTYDPQDPYYHRIDFDKSIDTPSNIK